MRLKERFKRIFRQDKPETRLLQETSDLRHYLGPKLDITFFDADPTDPDNASHVDRLTLRVYINIQDPKTIIHELGHYFDYIHHPNLSQDYRFHWIRNKYLEEFKKLGATQEDINYYCTNEEVFARLFQAWYQDIDPRLDFAKLTPQSTYYNESHVIAEKLYDEMPEVHEFFYDVGADIYNHIQAELEKEYQNDKGRSL